MLKPVESASLRRLRLQGLRAALATIAVSIAVSLPATVSAALVGSGAPDFTLPQAAGGNLRLTEQRGQVVMLNFWATWCGPCKQEMPKLNRLYEKFHGSGFVLLGMNIDDDPNNAIATASRLGVRFPVLLDTDKRVSKLYNLSDMPSTVLIDRDGRVRYVHLGYRDGYEDTYEKQVRELLRE